jgi:hypothetical protein
MTVSPPPSSSPSVGHLSEPLYVKQVPIESLVARLASQHHLARPLVAGWLESVDELSTGGEGDRSPVLVCWAERLQWVEPFLLGGLSALWTELGCTMLFIIFHPIYSNQFNSIQIQIQIQIWFELWKFVEA